MIFAVSKQTHQSKAELSRYSFSKTCGILQSANITYSLQGKKHVTVNIFTAENQLYNRD
jgi:hypothetical protein